MSLTRSQEMPPMITIGLTYTIIILKLQETIITLINSKPKQKNRSILTLNLNFTKKKNLSIREPIIKELRVSLVALKIFNSYTRIKTMTSNHNSNPSLKN